MIRKNIKNALYAEMLEVTNKLQSDIELQNEESTCLKRISNTLIPLLVKGGLDCYTKTDEWKDAEKLYLKINEKVYEIPMNQIRSALEQDYKKILDKRFKKEEANNIIDFTLADNFDFIEYIAHPYKIKQMKPNKPQKKNVDKNETIVKTEKKNNIKSENIKSENKDKQLEQVTVSENNKDKPVVEKITPLKETKKAQETPKISLEAEMEELIFEEEVKQIKPETAIETKPEKTIKAETPIEEQNDFDFLIDEPDIQIEKTADEKKEQKELEISTEELIMNIYSAKYTDESGTEKNFTIIVAPAKKPDEEESFLPIFAMAKSGKTVYTGASPSLSRSSYTFNINQEVFVVRGKWDKDGFDAYLYQPNSHNCQVTVQTRKMRPSSVKNIGHNIIEMENGYIIHILPLSSKNAKDNKTGLLVCLEDPNEEKFIPAYTAEDLTAVISYKNREYKITAGWEERKLKHKIQVT